MARIEIIDVCKTIKRNTVIDGINLTLESGKIFGLKGINGSGKTMLMRLITGLIRPTKGRIRIDGKELWKDISFPESVGLLLENPAFLDSCSGTENLRILAAIKANIDNARIDETIRLVGLSVGDKKKYKKYSLGMKQRLGIAAAVMESPDIVILDEPTNSLDSDGVEMVKQVVRAEKQRGALVILACHDFEILQELADEIYTMESGRITNAAIEERGIS